MSDNAWTQEGVYPPLRAAAIALQAHYPCAACDLAMASVYPGSQSCPEGEWLYGEQLRMLDEAIAKGEPR